MWHPQETHHGLILDRLQVELGRPPATPDLDSISLKLRILGGLAHLPAFQDVVRMLYYLTGMATERSAVIAYNLLHDGVSALGETGIAETVVAPIKRQEPGHYAFYQLSARGLWGELAGWQRWLVRRMRSISFAPVGANNATQAADFGEVMTTLGMSDGIDDWAARIARVETELLWARDRGLAVPAYVVRAFRDALERAAARPASDFGSLLAASGNLSGGGVSERPKEHASKACVGASPPWVQIPPPPPASTATSYESWRLCLDSYDVPEAQVKARAAAGSSGDRRLAGLQGESRPEPTFSSGSGSLSSAQRPPSTFETRDPSTA